MLDCLGMAEDPVDAADGPPLKRARARSLSLSDMLEDEFVHGTKAENLDSILQHGLVAKTHEIAFCEHFPLDGLVPGLKEPPEILIVLDQSKILRKGLQLRPLPEGEGQGFVTTGQVLQGGEWVPNDPDAPRAPGTIRPWFFKKILDNRPATVGNMLFLSKDAWSDPKWKKWSDPANLPDKLVHATAFGNLAGIWQRGVVPHGSTNPRSSGRTGHRRLLAGGEDHINAVVPERPGPDGIEVAGLDQPPDALITFDVGRAKAEGLQVVQSPHRPDHYFLRGEVPPSCFTGVHANVHVDLPKHLECKVVPPGEVFQTLPIIDLSLDRATVVQKVKWACSVPGFMQVINHGIDPELELKLLELQKKFFALPQEIKKACCTNAESPVRGYFGKGGENLDAVLEGESKSRAAASASPSKAAAKAVDNKEGLDLNGAPWSTGGDHWLSHLFGKPSRLPTEEELPGLRETSAKLSEQLMRLGKELLELMAIALGRDKDFFNRCMTQPVATHRLLHYWPIEGDAAKQIGCGEHTDYGLVTILKQDDVGGLQVLSAQDMQWVLVPPIQGAYVVNLGDMISQWTGNYFKSTVHRVVNKSNRERYSSPYFIEPNLDTVIRRGELRPCEASRTETAGDILHRFYSNAGMLKARHTPRAP